MDWIDLFRIMALISLPILAFLAVMFIRWSAVQIACFWVRKLRALP